MTAYTAPFCECDCGCDSNVPPWIEQCEQCEKTHPNPEGDR